MFNYLYYNIYVDKQTTQLQEKRSGRKDFQLFVIVALKIKVSFLSKTRKNIINLMSAEFPIEK